MTASAAERFHYEDFTEESYRRIVRAAKRSYSFEPFGTAARGAHVLWRHDIDMSVHRGLALARIEHDEGVRATYLLQLHSAFYNLLEAPVLAAARELFELGHWAGLHFDGGFHGVGTKEELTERLTGERETLSSLVERPVEVFSFHAPEAMGVHDFDDERMAGMISTYARSIREGYEYVSDSNGYWRHRRLPEVIDEAGHERLHVLTHPEWWQERVMSPRERMERAINGRAEHTLSSWESWTYQHEREIPG
ncbi:MAG: hypothetical protein ACRDKH_00195 [Solirubrobacterales bacterium]